MPNRHKIKVGDHLVEDEKTGTWHYAGEMQRDWDGVVVHRSRLDGEHPQYHVRSLQDPYPVGLIRPATGINFDNICGFYKQEFIPHTVIRRKFSIQDDLLPLPGIGQMAIGPPSNDCGHLFEVQGRTTPEPAYATIAATNTSFSEPSTLHTVELPGGIAIGNRVIACISCENSVTFTWPIGWFELFDSNNSTVSLSVGYIDVTGSEGFAGSNDTITVTSSSEEASSHICYRITGFDSIEAPQISSGATGSDTMPDPDTITPTTGVADYLTIAVQAHNTGSVDTTDIPVTYSNQIEVKTN